jgi:hypothetical protein
LANPDGVSRVWLGLIYIGLKKYDEALTQLERSYTERIINNVGLKINEDYDPIRNEPRFKALLKKLNFE